jgi:PAS domain S-box-containing protein
VPIPEHLQPQYRDLLHVVGTMNAGLLAGDLEGTILWANPPLLRWLGYSYDEILGMSAVDLGVAEHAESLRTEIKAIASGDLRPRLVVMRRSDSTTFPTLVIPQHFLDENGDNVGTFSIIVDMGTVQTAKRIGMETSESDLIASLSEIATRLRAMSLPPTFPSLPVPLRFDNPALAEVSRREREVLELLVGGDRVIAIAEQLFISDHTVRNHLKSVFRKTGTSSQAELIKFVRELR